MDPLNIAFLPIVRVQFDIALAEQMIQTARQHLQANGFQLLGPKQPVSDLDSARAALAKLPASSIDLLLIFQATFADSSMVVALNRAVDAPIFLWAIPEEWTGGRLRLNSLCGINLAGHALTLRNQKYEVAYTQPDDPAVIGSIHALAAAGRLRKQMQSARLGVVGEHPSGMDTCDLDEPRLNSAFGLQIERIPLEEVFSRARGIPKEQNSAVRKNLDTVLDNLDSLQQKPLMGTIGVYNALKDIAEERKLDGLAVRCWPEFFTELGCAACGAMSMLSDGFGGANPLPCSCEADINGTVTQLILQLVSGSPAFGTDMVAADLDQDMLALWHCGLAPFSMATPNTPKHGANHSNRGVPLVMDFPLKPGQVTIARVSQATGALRLVLGRGEIIAAPQPFSGTSGVLRLEQPVKEFLDTLLREGLEHHISMVYGDYLGELKEFAALISLPILCLSKGGAKGTL